MKVAAERKRARLFGDDTLAALLVQRQLLPLADAERCFEEAVKKGLYVEEEILRRGLLTEEELRRALENAYFCPAEDLSKPKADAGVLAMFPGVVARRHLAFPLRIEGRALRVALAEPDRSRVVEDLERVCGRSILPVVALRHELRRAIEQHYGEMDGRLPSSPASPRSEPPPSKQPPQPAAANVADPGQERAAAESLIRISAPGDALATVETLFRAAVRRRATDIHVEPGEHALGVRFRVDGVLQRVATLPRAMTGSVTSRLKVLGGMDIAERRAPQDGRSTLRSREQTVDLRISSLPSQHGEKIVVRLLRQDPSLLELDRLGMSADVRARHADVLEAPMGLFLVTGPTGSGKTTTLYASLAALDRTGLSVVTLEDPIEYALPGITQVQVHPQAGLTFATGLQSILRQDPDVILVGEIRDTETVAIACRAALTGHKVLSTLHANDACQAVTRLGEMGIDRALIAATLRGVLAQRLLRLNCDDCREPTAIGEASRRLLGLEEAVEAWVGRGCPACAGTGFRGRVAVHEYFVLDEQAGALVLDGSPAARLRDAARRAGMSTMADGARSLLVEGKTSPDEVTRVLLSNDAGSATCPGCGHSVRADFVSCPQCRRSLREQCPGCRRPVDDGWRACPDCGSELTSVAARSCVSCLAALAHGWDRCPYCGGEPR